jgi:hypothetical protein
MLKQFLFVALLIPSLAIAQGAPSIGCIEQVPDGFACECSLQSFWIKCSGTRGGLIFVEDNFPPSAPALMFLDGQVRHLRKVREQPVGLPSRREWFEGDGYSVLVRYRPAPDTCPEWKVKYDEGCTSVDLFATIRIKRHSDGAVQVIEAKGSCGT